ncbi:alpha/beta hydrolase [Fundicoccus culcitae]|uniref:Alpha/beta hydrolase n=1 Tax=Fundicoccus culcitae TaxID=2969821 RepID=A0ABY5P6S2_9LACT|nr:alpha/beta hydrolase [Fundicoccus culcitae]UUX34300.1 alpha/beta hydrolase [Fundicoccus culcitae]
MKHIYQKGFDQVGFTFVLLHGTGSNEVDILPLADSFDQTFNVLSIRGNVNENGALRYFRRLKEGVYDEDDLHLRGEELLTFIIEASQTYAFDIDKVVLLGFSNGSNIAINMLLRDDNPFKYAMLLAPMYPLEPENLKEQPMLKVFLSMGKHDPIVSLDDSKHVIDLFEARKAQVVQSWTNSHEVSAQTIIDGRKWLNEIKNN